MGALRIADPAHFVWLLHGAMSRCGTVGAAAEELGVSERTLTRWLSDYKEVPRAPRGRVWK
jgi:hypothetical protein